MHLHEYVPPARNDVSNRAEFLLTHRRLHSGEASEVLRPGEDEGEGDQVESASCARTDARTVDREVMIWRLIWTCDMVRFCLSRLT
jgi:hypothetical protein